MIQVDNITKQYGGTPVLDGISCSMESPGTYVISGPSGSGKTTLLRLIAGLELPDEGSVSLGGEVVSTSHWGMAPYRRSIGFVFQSAALWPHMTVAQHVSFGLTGITKREILDRVKEVLAQADLSHLAGRYPSKLSGGEKRRVAIARAVASRPRRLLMDEPLTNLDPVLKERLLSFILETQQKTRACLVYVTHDETEAHAVSGRHITLVRGRVIADGSTSG